MTWTIVLTVGGHEQNGFVHLARWHFPGEGAARAFIAAENAAIQPGSEPDLETDAFTFILDLHDVDLAADYPNIVDTSREIPTQQAMRLAPAQVQQWLAERPEPDSVTGWPPLLPTPTLQAA